MPRFKDLLEQLKEGAAMFAAYLYMGATTLFTVAIILIAFFGLGYGAFVASNCHPYFNAQLNKAVKELEEENPLAARGSCHRAELAAFDSPLYIRDDVTSELEKLELRIADRALESEKNYKKAAFFYNKAVSLYDNHPPAQKEWIARCIPSMSFKIKGKDRSNYGRALTEVALFQEAIHQFDLVLLELHKRKLSDEGMQLEVLTKVDLLKALSSDGDQERAGQELLQVMNLCKKKAVWDATLVKVARSLELQGRTAEACEIHNELENKFHSDEERDD